MHCAAVGGIYGLSARIYSSPVSTVFTTSDLAPGFASKARLDPAPLLPGMCFLSKPHASLQPAEIYGVLMRLRTRGQKPTNSV